MKTITVANGQYEVPSAEDVGLVAGYTLDAAAARHLYQTRNERIRNNIVGPIRKMKDKGLGHDEIADFVLKYAQNYQFSEAGRGPAPSVQAEVEAEQYTIANDYIAKHLAEKGRKPTDVPEGMSQEDWDAKFKENVERVARHPDTVKLAKKRVADRRKTIALSGVNL